jgi:hypothetical protein
MGIKLNGKEYGCYLNGRKMGGYVNGVKMFGMNAYTAQTQLINTTIQGTGEHEIEMNGVIVRANTSLLYTHISFGINSKTNTFYFWNVLPESTSDTSHEMNTGIPGFLNRWYNIKIKWKNAANGTLDVFINDKEFHYTFSRTLYLWSHWASILSEPARLSRQFWRRRVDSASPWTTFVDAHVVQKGSTEYSATPAPSDGWWNSVKGLYPAGYINTPITPY